MVFGYYVPYKHPQSLGDTNSDPTLINIYAKPASPSTLTCCNYPRSAGDNSCTNSSFPVYNNGCCWVPDSAFSCQTFGKGTSPNFVNFNRGYWSCSALEPKITCSYPVDIIPDTNPQSTTFANQLISYYNNFVNKTDDTKISAADLGKVMSKWCFTKLPDPNNKLKPRILMYNDEGDVCRQWASLDSNTKATADTAMTNYCSDPNNIPSDECSCLAAGQTGSTFYDLFETIIGAAPALNLNNTQCWLNPCISTYGQLTSQTPLIKSNMFDRSVCTGVTCNNIVISEGSKISGGEISQNTQCSVSSSGNTGGGQTGPTGPASPTGPTGPGGGSGGWSDIISWITQNKGLSIGIGVVVIVLILLLIIYSASGK